MKLQNLLVLFFTITLYQKSTDSISGFSWRLTKLSFINHDNILWSWPWPWLWQSKLCFKVLVIRKLGFVLCNLLMLKMLKMLKMYKELSNRSGAIPWKQYLSKWWNFRGSFQRTILWFEMQKICSWEIRCIKKFN